MSRFLSKQKLLVGVLVISSLGIGYALGAQPRMDAALALLQMHVRNWKLPSPTRAATASARSNSSTGPSCRCARALHLPPRTNGRQD